MTYKMTLALALLAACSTGDREPREIIVYRTAPVGDDDDDDTTPRGDDDDDDDVVGDDDDVPTDDTGTTPGDDDDDTPTETGDTGILGTVDTGTPVLTDTGTGGTLYGFPVSPLPDYGFGKNTIFDLDEPLPNSNPTDGDLTYGGNDTVAAMPAQVGDAAVVGAEIVPGPVTANDCWAMGSLDPNFAFTVTGLYPDLDEGTWMCVQSRDGNRVAMVVVWKWTDTLVVRVYQ